MARAIRRKPAHRGRILFTKGSTFALLPGRPIKRERIQPAALPAAEDRTVKIMACMDMIYLLIIGEATIWSNELLTILYIFAIFGLILNLISDRSWKIIEVNRNVVFSPCNLQQCSAGDSTQDF
jgi:hypothetical protein